MPLLPPLDFSSTYLESRERLCGKVAHIVRLTVDKRLYTLAKPYMSRHEEDELKLSSLGATRTAGLVDDE
jgi:hypothetical protein